jgi:pilus assembly protein CpaB
MRSTRAYLMIGFSVIAGIIAVIVGARWLADQASMATQQVVVAARDLDLGTALEPTMLEVVRWPSGSIPPGSIGDAKALEARVVKVSLQRGEPILEGKLTPIGTTGGLSAVIGDGKRAITVKVNEVVGVAGFALPGNYVDVLVNIRDERDSAISKIILEHILVLAVAQEKNRDETKPKVVNAVTLEATPEQAEKLDLARSVGTLSLVLRNQIDKAPVQTDGVHKGDLMQISAVKASPAPVARPEAKPVRRATTAPPVSRDKVEVIRGLQKSSVDF